MSNHYIILCVCQQTNINRWELKLFIAYPSPRFCVRAETLENYLVTSIPKSRNTLLFWVAVLASLLSTELLADQIWLSISLLTKMRTSNVTIDALSACHATLLSHSALISTKARQPLECNDQRDYAIWMERGQLTSQSRIMASISGGFYPSVVSCAGIHLPMSA
jgi:hypothetical protein